MRKHFECLGLLLAISFGVAMLRVNGGFLANNKAKNAIKQPVYVQYFKQGDTMWFAFSHDTLIVDRAIQLNKAIAFDEQGFIEYNEAQLDSVFKLYCRKIN